MCGIVGYVGSKQAAPILLESLAKLEYRGYDSAGLAVRDGDKDFVIVKAKGRLSRLARKTDGGNAIPGTCGIGHTRWATHGEPSETNAHPHMSDDGNVVGVHNGIIENYQELKAKLLRHNYKFYSDTDTEVAIKLIDYYYKKYEHTPVDAINHAMVRIRGTYAFALMFKSYPGEIYVARKDAPMIIGKAKDGDLYLASDVPAILKYTRDVYYIGQMEIGRLANGEVTFFNLDGDVIEKKLTTVEWDAASAEKGGFEHFMMKEIHEQPKAVRDTLNAYIKDETESAASKSVSDKAADIYHAAEAEKTKAAQDTQGTQDASNKETGSEKTADTVKNSAKVIDLSALHFEPGFLAGLERLYFVACGSAYHVGMAAKYSIEKMTRVPVEVDLASEFRYRDPILVPNSMVIIISQSGETADSLAAMRLAKEMGVPTLAVVNVIGSSIAREADHVMYTYAGPEIAVATTKAYSAQLICTYILGIALGIAKGRIDQEKETAYINALEKLPDQISKILEDKERIQWFASKYANAHDVFFIGRGLDYAICLEGSLKMKEISYIHSEAYAAGELKHGTISLIEDGTLVIGVMTQNDLYEKTRSNLVEVKARGAYLMGLTNYGNYSTEDTVNFAVYVPKTEAPFTASLAVIPLQLMGYYLSVAKGLDVDKPRNLAKSVTVE
ncbi:MAG: glutamine--fructose-6-phosphate aminotransferase [Lachnospiraceae bacterium]|jgi:glucosamine--fructose-6-phosphate aminotransferase (isomerizing)|nr:glutamine--fructose-6-phosphate aminotransferase [Lachnospiraceae bacterium]MCH4028416.1 glutamine--fructose-6-phosphate aminotransferase [Lachnospiraceae bacterium]MCH4066265.1 glutamine--fructose-6-phosphate aminotransferase [Lachnospiraceae bacterium]MCH4112296.1 glutamine--fructose-6-phosphate aminotransferase [Lachnospiraceae bacterium]MCI1391469.1 glutamine--fructose-6-phosphate aminotransferase [Lachnospiraceae bacterium]